MARSAASGASRRWQSPTDPDTRGRLVLPELSGVHCHFGSDCSSVGSQGPGNEPARKRECCELGECRDSDVLPAWGFVLDVLKEIWKRVGAHLEDGSRCLVLAGHGARAGLVEPVTKSMALVFWLWGPQDGPKNKAYDEERTASNCEHGIGLPHKRSVA